MQVIRSPKVYDAIIVGSGAAGGTAAQRLTAAGLDVALLEAGPELVPSRDYNEHKWPYEFADRGRTMKAGLGGWRLPGEPYVVAPGNEFRWWRARTLGGRTNNWGRHSYRLAEWDFHPRDRFGVGTNWPIRYQDLESYYGQAERLLGVSGSKEGIPSLPDGDYLPPMKPKCHEALLSKGAEKLGMRMIPVRRAVLTESLHGLPACHWCGACDRGCVSGSKYCSIQFSIEPALKTGRLTLLTGSMAREIVVDNDGRAVAVSYIDKPTRAEREIRGKRILLAASTLESARLLLNSKSRFHPGGLGNSSGHLGRHLTDTVGTGQTFGYLPQLLGRERVNEDGIHSGHVVIPWWKYDRKNKFAGGYHVEVYGGFAMPSLMFSGQVARHSEGYGAEFKQAARDYFGAFVGVKGTGESFANPKSYVEIDDKTADRWGVPVLRVHFEWSENDYLMAEDMQQQLRGVIEASGGVVFEPNSPPARRAGMIVGGSHIHELGTARMGRDPKSSVTNPFGQVWDSPNVSVIDGAVFVTNPDKNPTLTLVALAMRACDKILDEGA